MARIWIELEAGSTVFTDHTLGEPYFPVDWKAPEGFNSEGNKPSFIWQWIDSTSIIPAGSVETDYITISENKTSAFHRMFFQTNLPIGEYELRAGLHDIPLSERGYTGFVDKCYWEFLQEIIEDDLCYPNVALYAISALATSKLSGSLPTVDMIAERTHLAIYNATTSSYDAVLANNPAWICYDLLHKARCLLVDEVTDAYIIEVYGIPHTQIDYLKFKEWADWCDE